jgi:hypothetical protein
MKKLAALAFAGACLTLQAQSQTLDPHQKLTLDIYRELIEINTVFRNDFARHGIFTPPREVVASGSKQPRLSTTKGQLCVFLSP